MFCNMATITAIVTKATTSTSITTTATATTQTGGIVKKPGPPVPPRPTASLIATTLRTSINTQRNISGSVTAVTRNNYTNYTPAALTSFQAHTTNETKINAIKTSIEQEEQQKHHNNYNNNNNNNINNNNINQPSIIHKKPIVNRQNSAGGRTVIYKSPSINVQQYQEKQQHQQQQHQQQQLEGNKILPTVRTSIAPKPPLKLRKAPDVPKPLASSTEETTKSPSDNKDTIKQQMPSTNGVTLNRHNSMGCASISKPAVSLKETRLSLGRVDTNKYGKISVDQLQLSSQPLPKPRKIIQMPVATLDLGNKGATSTMANIFRRSKTTLDNITSRGNVAAVNTANSSSPNRFLGGRTVEFKNNLKNAAERLFAEMMVSQSHKQVTEPPPTIITKHERAIQHPMTLTSNQQSDQPHQQQHQQKAITVTLAVNNKPPTPVTSEKAEKVNVIQSNFTRITRININGTESSMVSETTQNKEEQIESMLNSPEKKAAFHEILISELAAMRAKSSSMDNLQTKTDHAFNSFSTPTKNPQTRDLNANMKSSSTNTHLRCNSEDEYEQEHDDDDDLQDNEDVDADNVEDAECDEEFLRKTLKLCTKNATRKRCPSGCSSDSSPFGTERFARIRTSVEDNGKEVTLTSCHISLEDSGLEDEERMDDISSGVGDSWDSVKESQKEQRCHNIKRLVEALKIYFCGFQIFNLKLILIFLTACVARHS